jgi:hypothetical protein
MSLEDLDVGADDFRIAAHHFEVFQTEKVICRPLRGLDYLLGDLIQGWRDPRSLTPG